MIHKSWAYSVAVCQECGSLIIWTPAKQDFPAICEKCGVPKDVSPTVEQRQQMEQRQHQQQHPQGGHSFNIRFG